MADRVANSGFITAPAGTFWMTNLALPICEIQTGPTDYLSLQEIMIGCPAGSNSGTYTLAVGVPANKGVGINGISLQQTDAGCTNSSVGARLYKDWTNPPSVPSTYLRRYTYDHVATVGTRVFQTVLFRFRRGYKMATSGSLAVFAISGSATAIEAIFEVNITVSDP